MLFPPDVLLISETKHPNKQKVTKVVQWGSEYQTTDVRYSDSHCTSRVECKPLNILRFGVESATISSKIKVWCPGMPTKN